MPWPSQGTSTIGGHQRYPSQRQNEDRNALRKTNNLFNFQLQVRRCVAFHLNYRPDHRKVNPKVLMQLFLQIWAGEGSSLIKFLAGWPGLIFLFTALILVGLFLCGIWLRLQPQPYFLHLVIFNLLLLVYSTFLFLPAKWVLVFLAQFRFARYTQIAYHLIMIYWLATAPFGYIRPKPDLTPGQIWRRRSFGFIGSAMFLGLALFLDRHGLWLPFPNFDLYLWLVPVLLAIVLALIFSTRKFIKSMSEYFIYLATLGLFVLASYIHIFVDRQASILPALFGGASIILLVLMYHRRFVNIEVELRHGLLDENMQLREQAEIQNRVLANTRMGIVFMDREERVRYANPVMLQMLGKEMEQIRGEPLRKVLGRKIYEVVVPALKEARVGHEANFELTWPGGASKKANF
ncbi:MAG: PAS domain-containing protein, partial [Calditrichaeota bacterium]